MQYLKSFLPILFFIYAYGAFSQSVEIEGKVITSVDAENIHVVNKTAQFFTITDKNGIFKITVKLYDTLTFSSIQHQLKTVVVDESIIRFKTISVALEELINNLDEVVVGKMLTGNLFLDIGNAERDVPINFYDVGIQGYKGKIATLSERRLSEASNFNPTAGGSLGGLGGSLSATAIINAISGRTKQLRNQVELEEKDALMQSIKGRLAKDFFASNPMEEDLKMDFFYFCADDDNFTKYCKNQTDFKTLIFLRMKYRQYLENLNVKEK